MKLIIAIVQDYDVDKVLRAVTAAGFRVTRLASVGGFLRSTNTALLLGVDDAEVERCLSIVRGASELRYYDIDRDLESEWMDIDGSEVAPVAYGGAVVLVLPIERFEQLYADRATTLDTSATTGAQ
jgi:uncharacterized protein YaaQ